MSWVECVVDNVYVCAGDVYGLIEMGMEYDLDPVGMAGVTEVFLIEEVLGMLEEY